MQATLPPYSCGMIVSAKLLEGGTSNHQLCMCTTILLISKILHFLMCQPSLHMLRTNAKQAQLKMIVDYSGPRKVLLKVLQPLSHGSIRARLPVSSGFCVYALIIAHPACY